MEEIDATPTATPMMAAPGGLSWKGLWQVFAAPSRLFDAIKDHPRVLVPYFATVAMLLVFLIASAGLMVDALMPVMLEQFAERGVDPQNVPRWAMALSFSVPFGFLYTIEPLVEAVLALLIGNFILAGKARFKQTLSVMLYGTFLFHVGSVVVLPLMFAKGTPFVSLSLAMLLATPTNPQQLGVLWVTLSKIDLFIIWQIVVVGIGLSKVYGFSRNKGYLTAVLSVGFVSVLNILQTAIGRLFA